MKIDPRGMVVIFAKKQETIGKKTSLKRNNLKKRKKPMHNP